MAGDAAGERLRRKLAALPAEPGVYIFTDTHHRVIYVGKAASLRARVRSYFQPGADDGRPLFRRIVDQTADVDCVVCANEIESLLLENNLIKKHRPRYNIRLRDDKTYISLRVTLSEKWPRVQLVRQWKDDGNAYFGPYSSSQSVRDMLRVLKRHFPLRTCSNGFFRGRKRPCLEFEIGHCTAPCVGLIDEQAYRRWVDETLLFLRGRDEPLLTLLQERMESAAAARGYERAARVRDQMAAIRRVFERQKVQEVRFGDQDIFGLHRRGDFVSMQVILNREGKLIHSSTHSFRTELDDGEVLASFLTQFYGEERYLPAEVLLPFAFPERAVLESWLTERRRRKLRMFVPQRGDKRRLVEMASHNAEVNSSADELREEARQELARRLGEALALPQPLYRIECYDVAHIQGTLTVASRVVFEAGEPTPALYRRYKLRSATGNDDFTALLEVLSRRFADGGRREPPPDVVLVDGGKGQVGSAREALRARGLDVPLIGIAKDRRRAGRHTTERLFASHRGDPLPIEETSPESRFLQRVRDEAHRFANDYHRELRRKQALTSGLEEIPGIGRRRREALLAHFGTLRALRHATVEEIAAVPGMTEGTAQATFDFFRAR